MPFVPYLNFPGHAAEAFAAYAGIFGGTLETSRFSDIPPGTPVPELPAEQRDWLMHAQLQTPDGAVLMGSDAPPQFADPSEPDGHRQSGVSVAVTRPDAASARALFDRLAEGGTETMPSVRRSSPRGSACAATASAPTGWSASAEAAPSSPRHQSRPEWRREAVTGDSR